MYRLDDLRLEVVEALDRIWFIRSVQVIERTDKTLFVRLVIRHNLFVNVFLGEKSSVLYFALIEDEERIFGIDRDERGWHQHAINAVNFYEPLAEGLEPKPLLTFLARVEEILLQNDLI